QHGEELEAAGDLPTAEVPRRGVAPDVAGEAGSGLADFTGDLLDLRARHAALRFGGGGCGPGVVLLQGLDEAVERARAIGVEGLEEVAPVDPGLDELAVVQPLVEDDAGHGQQQHRLGARVQIGRASGRERAEPSVETVSSSNKLLHTYTFTSNRDMLTQH